MDLIQSLDVMDDLLQETNISQVLAQFYWEEDICEIFLVRKKELH